MKKPVAILLLAMCGIALSGEFTTASATRMNGRCCQSSDGGRSHRAGVVLARRAIPRTCSAYAASCMRVSLRRGDASQLCQAAKAQCLRTGIHHGPYSGVQIAGLRRM
jgi:hypothetical protein